MLPLEDIILYLLRQSKQNKKIIFVKSDEKMENAAPESHPKPHGYGILGCQKLSKNISPSTGFSQTPCKALHHSS